MCVCIAVYHCISAANSNVRTMDADPQNFSDPRTDTDSGSIAHQQLRMQTAADCFNFPAKNSTLLKTAKRY